MDPITTAVLAVLAVAGTEATKEVGKKLGSGTITAAQSLWALRLSKAPDTANRLLAAGNDPDVIDAEVIEEVRQMAADDPEVAAAVAATRAATKADDLNLQSLTKLADKIGVVNLGTVEKQDNIINI
jgi:hypothetical protein